MDERKKKKKKKEKEKKMFHALKDTNLLQMIHSSKKKKKKSFFKTRNGVGCWNLWREREEEEEEREREREKKQRRVPARFNAVATAARRHKFPLFRKLWKGTEQKHGKGSRSKAGHFLDK